MSERRDLEGAGSLASRANGSAAWALALKVTPFAGRRVGRAALLRRWAAASTASLQCTYHEWFDPTTVGVVDAVVGYSELDEALDAFVAARMAAGFSLAGTAADLQALLTITPERLQDRFDRVDLARRISRAWPAGSVAALPTGEISRGLSARVHAACSRSTSRIGSAAGPTLLIIDGDPDQRDQLAVAAVRWIDEVFPAAEVLGSVGPGRFLAVVHSHRPQPDPAALLGTVLRASPGGGQADVRSEPWPVDADDALSLVSRLAVPETAVVPEPEVAPAAAILAFPAPAAAAAAAVGGRRVGMRTAAGAVATAAAVIAMVLTGGTVGEIHPQTAIGPTAPHLDVPAPAPSTTPAAASPAPAGAAVRTPASLTRVRHVVPAPKPVASQPAPAPSVPATSTSDPEDSQPHDTTRPTPPLVSLPFDAHQSMTALEIILRAALTNAPTTPMTSERARTLSTAAKPKRVSAVSVPRLVLIRHAAKFAHRSFARR